MATRPVKQKLADEVEYWNILLCADSGAGKTVFAGQDNRVLFIATEDAGRNSGTLSAARMGSTAEKITVHEWEDVKNAYEWYEDNPEELKDVNVLVIDSLPEMQRLAKEYCLKMSAPEKIRKNRDPEKMELPDYGNMHELVENMVRGMNDLPVNVLYTATAKKVEDADKIEFMVPDIQGKGDYGFAMKMVALMTSYGFMRIELAEVPAPTEENPEATKLVKQRMFYWEDTGTIRAKDRTCSLTPFTVNMTLQQMRRAIKGELKRTAEGKFVKVVAPQQLSKTPAKAPAKKVAPQPSPQPEAKVESDEASKPVEPANAPKPEPVKQEPVIETKGEQKEVELESVEA